ncbi:M42 family metallopeptidase [Helicovermis profundi]|uniref:M42 family metallopeptidase n=1 Tax=Helicovermis profundi TaxID=3065157 RepID=A0AAU9E338_9FIRM|nr:M42 family metallopeptidase [Clostridia bacterium S502]
MFKDKKYLLTLLKELLNIPSPTGYADGAIRYVEDEFLKLDIPIRKTNKGALIATINGKNDEKHKLLSAHVDTLGAMVKEIKSNGRLKISKLGGFSMTSIEGEYINIFTSNGKNYSGTVLFDKASTHVHGNIVNTEERNDENIEIRIDELVNNKEDVKNLGIEIGDFISFDPRVIISESGFIKSRHLDDKSAVASLLAMAKYIRKNSIELPYTTHFFISNYEEVGHGSSAGIPEKTVEFLAVDMAAIGKGQSSSEQKVTICAKDSSGPYDFKMKEKLVSLAKENTLDYVVDIYPHYGSDASAAIRAGWDVRHGLIGPGVDSSHSFERTHIDALLGTIDLGIKYMLAELV